MDGTQGRCPSTHLGNRQMLANPSRGLDVLGLDTCTLKGLWSTLWGGQLLTGFSLHLDVGSMTGTQDALPAQVSTEQADE